MSNKQTDVSQLRDALIAGAPKNITVDSVHTYRGVTVHAQVDPCSWMYPGYGLQVSVSLTKRVSIDFVPSVTLNRKMRFADARDSDVTEMVQTFLRDGGLAKLSAAVARYAATTAELAELRAAEMARTAAKRASMKAQGFTYELTAWVHPGGDDYAVVEYHKTKPTPRYIRSMLTSQGSTVLTDYVVRAL